jgi:hypothetical protein
MVKASYRTGRRATEGLQIRANIGGLRNELPTLVWWLEGGVLVGCAQLQELNRMFFRGRVGRGVVGSLAAVTYWRRIVKERNAWLLLRC